MVLMLLTLKVMLYGGGYENGAMLMTMVVIVCDGDGGEKVIAVLVMLTICDH